MLGEYHDKISAIAEKLNVDAGSVYALIEDKTKPLVDRLKAEFAKTEEFSCAVERKNIIEVYRKEKADFAFRYGCDEKLYDFCFNVFGELMNRGYYEEITSNHKPLEAIKNYDWGLMNAKNLIRNIQQIFRVDESELDLIKQKMECANIINKEAYYRKMILDGYIIRLDLADIREMIRLLSNTTGNLNQIAKRVNADGSVFASDINDIKEDYETLWLQVKEVLKRLATI